MNLDDIFLTNTSNKNQIDIVYTFVDPNDSLWRNKYKLYNKNLNNTRFDFGNEQILFSIKTVKKYMNWVNKIFIVSDNQKFLLNDTFMEKKIVWINHQDIIPSKYLPTFNSRTIEAHLGNIHNLSEHFLYMNDDMFLGKKIDYLDFFNTSNIPIQFYSKCNYYSHSWIQNIKSTNKLFRNYYKNHTDICPQHAPYFIQKSVFIETKYIFEKFLLHMFQHDKIRTYNHYAHNLLFLYAMYSHYKKLSILQRTSFSSLSSLKKETIEKIKSQRKKFYCFFSRSNTKEWQSLYKELQNVILT